MVGRDRSERHRPSTPLELLFDLCFVVAVSQAGGELHQGLAAGRLGVAVLGYLGVFFAIWWAWVNFTWFASAYDVDDVPYRLLSLVQIAGGLVLAAGVPAAFERFDFTIVTAGYAIMRLALVSQWLRVAWEDPPRRATAFRFAAGLTLVQVGWVARLALPQPWGWLGFLPLAGLDLAVPIWAERSGPRTPWHPGHITERYGLFTLIVLGESVLAATVAVQSAFAAHGPAGALVTISAAGLLLVFGLWWSYFKRPAGEALRAASAFAWGYGHYAVFAAAAALGAGLQVAAEVVSRKPSGLGPVGAAFAVALPVAVYLAVVGVLQTRVNPERPVALRFLAAALLVLVAAAASAALPLPVAILAMAAVLGLLVSLDVVEAQRGKPLA